MSGELFAELRQHFRESARPRVEEMSMLATRLRSDAHDGDSLEQLVRHFHALAGLGATYGFARVSELADEGEASSMRLMRDRGAPASDVVARWEELIDGIAREIRVDVLKGARMWTARRILKELVDADGRRAILSAFWKHAETHSKLMAQMQLAKALHFRDETIRKMPPDKKAELLASRIGVPEFDQFLEMALMAHHTHEKNALMAAFLDRWNVPHNNGSIEAEEYKAPTSDEVRAAVNELSQFDKRDVRLYLATAGLLMADEWRDAAWPVVDELVTAP